QLISLRSSIDPNCKGTAIFIKAKFIIRYPIIVDLNHSNSGKKYKEQPRIAAEVMHSRRQAKHLAGMIPWIDD
ncbi:MAG: hypothetical protein JXO49_00515, partial [Deltaproteobacteria bacterium]|nr:hypothetical protein [Candidatus Anaeroferrophillus wilburensis]MBN2887807.1 hypothetical protein [Deltaproteobacteria bacterium]